MPHLLETLARDVPHLGRRVLVAVDGVDGSGKTRFAAGLAQQLTDLDRQVVVVHADDFLNPRTVRYRLGRESPEGFYRDSVDRASLIRFVLDPLGSGGDGRFRRRGFDHLRDAPVDDPDEVAPGQAVVIVEGMFLHRDELRGRWDWSLFLDVPFQETARRMSVRDGSSPDPEHPSMRRYVQGQRLYLTECAPWARATHVVDNTDVEAPVLVAPGRPTTGTRPRRP
ncbi:uridine kinase [Antribacter gilvus]|uniref:uridine kinase n=1 Tax=Antribacter gilvus TaxID=2304675 RepID=UPI000F7A7492|nr:uridine kinase [Antribacter gilvus]